MSMYLTSEPKTNVFKLDPLAPCMQPTTTFCKLTVHSHSPCLISLKNLNPGSRVILFKHADLICTPLRWPMSLARPKITPIDPLWALCLLSVITSVPLNRHRLTLTRRGKKRKELCHHLCEVFATVLSERTCECVPFYTKATDLKRKNNGYCFLFLKKKKTWCRT